MYVIKSNRKTDSYTVRKINRVTQVVRVGRRGLQGEAGATGPQGPQGDPGDPATNLVQSVNGKQGVVVLDAADVGADPTGSASQALSDAKNYTDTEVSTLDSSLATVAKTGSYNDLSNKPTIPSIAGLATEAQVQDVQDNLDAHEADTANPHNVTKAQVGLGNVDNTSDANKPVSTAQQTALDSKRNRITNTSTYTRVYTVNAAGTIDSSEPYTPSLVNGALLQRRAADGTVDVGTGTSGLNAVNKAQMDTADALKLNISDNRVELRGVGFPQGVVSAPVGTTYVDTAATNGAVEWKKATGTGNTGWVVSVGDTGWRNVSTDVANGWTGGLLIRRTGNIVYISAGRYGLTGAAATSDAFYTLPLGFRASGSGNFGFIGVAGVGSAIPTMELIQATRHTHLVSCRARNEISGDWSFLTANAWPSTLPGTAV